MAGLNDWQEFGGRARRQQMFDGLVNPNESYVIRSRETVLPQRSALCEFTPESCQTAIRQVMQRACG